MAVDVHTQAPGVAHLLALAYVPSTMHSPRMLSNTPCMMLVDKTPCVHDDEVRDRKAKDYIVKSRVRPFELRCDTHIISLIMLLSEDGADA